MDCSVTIRTVTYVGHQSDAYDVKLILNQSMLDNEHLFDEKV